jgi:hypothetical protein
MKCQILHGLTNAKKYTTDFSNQANCQRTTPYSTYSNCMFPCMFIYSHFVTLDEN